MPKSPVLGMPMSTMGAACGNDRASFSTAFTDVLAVLKAAGDSESYRQIVPSTYNDRKQRKVLSTRSMP